MATQISSEHGRNGQLYRALSDGDDDKVCEMCLRDGPLHILTIHNESVLYVASYYKRNKLVLRLLDQVPEGEHEKLTLQNESGNTILHAMATNNKTVEAASAILRRAPSLLSMTDKHGETALFRAARRGKTKIFHFLQAEVSKKLSAETLRTILVRDNKSTALHVAIHSENFNLALYIAENYPYLIGEEDGDRMTALQLLACKPSAFDSGVTDSFFKKFIYRLIDPRLEERTSTVPIIKQIQKQKHKSESAKKLATFLIEMDVSWEATEPMSSRNRVKLHKHGGDTTDKQETSSEKSPVDIVIAPRNPDSPLFLATRSGCTDIVKGILDVYPQAIEYIDENGRDILHVAIKYRRMDVYNYVTSMKSPMSRLRRKIDKFGNSILHMVALKETDKKAEAGIRSPAQVLRDDLIMFENVENICTTLATLQVDNNGATAEQLFIENNEKLRTEAKEWMKSTAEHSSLVAVLIATVAFAAAYTVPGGPDQDTGYPLLKSKPLFTVFALADALSLTFSLTSVIIFLSILTSPFKLDDFRTTLHNKLLLGFTVLIFSVAMMMVAFAATLILTISSRQHWTRIILYAISFFPVTVFVFSYVELYINLAKALVGRMRKMIDSIRPTETNDEESPPSNVAADTTICI